MQILLDELKKLDPETLKQLRKSVEHLIDHAAHRIEYAESRREAIATLGGALIAGSLVLLSIGSNQALVTPIKYMVLTVSGIWMLVGATTWLVFFRQTNFHYPFTDVANNSKWFYRYALANYRAFNPPWHTIQTNVMVEAGKRAFNDQWEQFSKKQVEILSNVYEDTLEDLQQLYLLHVNERYKNLFLTQLRNVLIYGILLSLAGAIGGLTIGYLLGGSTLSQSQSTFTNTDFGIQSSWRGTGQSRTSGTGSLETQLLVNMTITNRSQRDQIVTENQISLVDSVGLRIPFFVDSLSPSTINIPVGSGSKATLLIWVPDSLRSSINHMDVVP